MDDMDDREWLVYRLGRAQQVAERMLPDVWSQGPVELASSSVRLDLSAGMLQECWEAVAYLQQVVAEREREFDADGTFSEPQAGRFGLVANVRSVATARVYPYGGAVANRDAGTGALA